MAHFERDMKGFLMRETLQNKDLTNYKNKHKKAGVVAYFKTKRGFKVCRERVLKEHAFSRFHHKGHCYTTECRSEKNVFEGKTCRPQWYNGILPGMFS